MKHRWTLYAAALFIAAGILPAACRVARAHRVAMGVRNPTSPGGEILLPLLFLALAYILDRLLQRLWDRPRFDRKVQPHFTAKEESAACQETQQSPSPHASERQGCGPDIRIEAPRGPYSTDRLKR